MRRALVTGASGEIGLAIARSLAGQGHHVILHANSRAVAVERLAAEICDRGGSAGTVTFDVTDPEETRRCLNELLEEGAIQILVNNAGVCDDAPMAGMSFEQWHRVIDVALHGFFNVTQPLLLPMMQTRWGRIVSVSSVSGIMGNPGQTNYASGKAGLHGASKSLARELASRGVTVNVIAPGLIESEMTRDRFSEDEVKSLVPMRRMGRPEEVGALAGFLCSDDASFVSGQIIAVDGAMT